MPRCTGSSGFGKSVVCRELEQAWGWQRFPNRAQLATHVRAGLQRRRRRAHEGLARAEERQVLVGSSR